VNAVGALARNDRTLRTALALLGGASALVPAVVMWGFTVDDALIPLRYAHHLASGAGYRFNAHGPSTDGVTPLLWAPLLAVVSGAKDGDLLAALVRVKISGIVAWTAAGTALGRALALRSAGDRWGTIHAAVALVILALAFPVGAWAASGMETGIATALATVAVIDLDRARRSAALAGLAACLRPELVVWALAIAGGAAIGAPCSAPPHERTWRNGLVLAECAALALGPFVLCAVARLAIFGRAAPLALLAKPSDLSHGLVYAGAASIVALTPVLAFAPLALRRASWTAKTIVAAAAVHVLVVIAVGGDWMPYARLMVPIAPSLVLAYAECAKVARPLASLARAAVVLVVGCVVAASAAPSGRSVHQDRKELVEKARPLLASSRVIAALDVGWVGAATDAEIVDLAGLTDPAIAALPGGHTSKAVDLGMLLDRDVDTIVVYSQPRAVELRLVESRLFAARFDRTADVPFGARGAAYAIFRRRPDAQWRME
jgi:hypothetical protein